MKHPSEATLALYAGGDLGSWSRWRTERHLAGCDRCRLVVDEFAGTRETMAGLDDLPGLPWNRLAAEMKANIRLGLEAGACVRELDGRPVKGLGQPVFPGWRALVACVSMVALVVAGILLERPAPPAAEPIQGTVLRVTTNGIELSEDGQAMILLHKGDQEVTYSAGAQGSMGARYVAADSGYVTMNNVYVQ